MRRLTPAEVRFLVLRGFQSLSRSLRRDLTGKPDVAERAQQVAVDIVAERFDFGRMKN